MTHADCLRDSFIGLEVNDERTEATVLLRDESRLHFRHSVDQRQAEATGGADASDAGRILATIAMFRLNRRHLDIAFADGSRWEALFGEPGRPPRSIT
jgi:hypothetical protein